MEDKYANFYADLKKLITEFADKKKYYYRMYVAIKTAIIIFSTLSTISVSLIFIEEYQDYFKVFSIIFSGLSSIFIALEKVLNYGGKWRQRTITTVRLQKVKRAFKNNVLCNQDDAEKDSEFEKLVELQNDILNDDLNIWKEVTDIDD